MTDQERICLNKTVELYNELNKLSLESAEGGGKNDMLEATFHLHAIQNYIFARSSIREYLKEKQ